MKNSLRYATYLLALVAVLSLVMAGILCGMHADHDAHCECPVCRAVRALGTSFIVILMVAALSLLVRHARARATIARYVAGDPVRLSVKLNC